MLLARINQRSGKKALRKVLSKKNDFDDSRITFIFNDVIVTIYTNKKEDLLILIKNVDIIIEYLRSSISIQDNLDIDFKELNALIELTKD